MDLDEALGVINIFGKALEIAIEVKANRVKEARIAFEIKRTMDNADILAEALSKNGKCSKELLPFSKEKIRLAAKILYDSGNFDDLNELHIESLINYFE